MAKKGKLIGIGVGPGDTELLTLKAAKVLESVPPSPRKKQPASPMRSFPLAMRKQAW